MAMPTSVGDDALRGRLDVGEARGAHAGRVVLGDELAAPADEQAAQARQRQRPTRSCSVPDCTACAATMEDQGTGALMHAVTPPRSERSASGGQRHTTASFGARGSVSRRRDNP